MAAQLLLLTTTIAPADCCATWPQRLLFLCSSVQKQNSSFTPNAVNHSDLRVNEETTFVNFFRKLHKKEEVLYFLEIYIFALVFVEVLFFLFLGCTLSGFFRSALLFAGRRRVAHKTAGGIAHTEEYSQYVDEYGEKNEETKKNDKY